ncbi:MAG: SDR family oxidoreductase [Anaerolineae bacterium]|nr:SDR family oxidoreductase [Anaerolineae bacterium]
MAVTKPKILVTGGSGYLGGWVVRLARTGWDVTATYFTHPVDESNAIWRRLDVRNEAAVAALVAEVRPAVIVHTAACNPGYGGADFEATNAAGSGHVARAAAAHRARLIHISSDVVFDGERGNYVEDDSPSPITPYGHSKALAEEEVRASGAEAVIVRTSLIYGWRPRLARQVRWIVDDLEAGKPVRLFTDELRCPVWVESLAAAAVELAGLDYTGVLHVAGAQILSRYEFGVRLLRFHGLDPGSIIPARCREVGAGFPRLRRPLDGPLDCSRARALLCTPLPGVDEVLGSLTPRPDALQ